MSLLNPLSNAFGLDIGDRTFKIVQVVRAASGHGYRITAWNTIDVPEGVMEGGDIKDMAAADVLLKKLVSTCKGRLRGGAVVACLPEAKTFIKIISVPLDTGESGLREAVAREIEQNIPLPEDELYSDWQVLMDPALAAAAKLAKTKHRGKEKAVPEKPAPAQAVQASAAPSPAPESAEAPAEVRTEPAERKVLMGAAPKTLVDSYTDMLEKAGLAPIALEIEASAISRSIIPTDEFNDEAVGILDIGATRSSLVIYDSGALQMSISIPISGIAITKLISESLNVSMDDAEKLKKECGLDANRCEDKMWNIMLPLIDDITDKIRNALRFYKIGFPTGKKIERIYLCGGGALYREIDTVLSRKLTIRTLRGNALANVDAKLPKAFPMGDEALQYATAIGLAINAADENARHRNSLA